MSSFCAKILLPKNYKPKLKSCANEKAAHISEIDTSQPNGDASPSK
jgi:hypothetical protein